VESAEGWEALRTLQCDQAQGFYLSSPLPAGDLERWIQTSPWGLPSVAPKARF
jgi:EAL domain-containing protein (putative c-di-GMP-specific phosphodiesterase class I)